MAISKTTVEHVAQLAKLKFSADEINQFTNQLGDIIDMVERLESVDTTDVPATTHGYALQNVWREDAPETGDNREKLFKNVKAERDGLIQVPAIMEDEGEGA